MTDSKKVLRTPRARSRLAKAHASDNEILTLFVNHGRDTLDTTSSGKTSDGWLGYALDVVSKNLPVSLGTTLAETPATFAASSHVEGCLV